MCSQRDIECPSDDRTLLYTSMKPNLHYFVMRLYRVHFRTSVIFAFNFFHLSGILRFIDAKFHKDRRSCPSFEREMNVTLKSMEISFKTDVILPNAKCQGPLLEEVR